MSSTLLKNFEGKDPRTKWPITIRKKRDTRDLDMFLSTKILEILVRSTISLIYGVGERETYNMKDGY